MEITMHLSLGLTHIVTGDHLVKPLDQLALQHRKVYHLLKTFLDQVYVVHPLEYIDSTIVLCTNQYYHSNNKMKQSLIHIIIVTYIWHAQVYTMKERCMYLLFKSKIFIVKMFCVLISSKYELYEVFYTEIFQIYGIEIIQCETVNHAFFY